jgi:hypothetical protein
MSSSIEAPAFRDIALARNSKLRIAEKMDRATFAAHQAATNSGEPNDSDF